MMRYFDFRTAALVVLFVLSLSASCFVRPAARGAGLAVAPLSNDRLLPVGRASARRRLTLDEEAATATREEASTAVARREGAAESSDDIIRDIDGRPLSPAYFARQMGLAAVESYACPEKDVFRGFMSNACRVRLAPGGETAFYKSVFFEELDHAREKLRSSPHKLVRDAESYRVVAAFLSSRACEEVVAKAGVRIPKCYDAQARPDRENPIASKFSFLFEDYTPWDGWYQRWLIQDAEECEAALTALAKLHAFFWEGADFWRDAEAGRELEAAIWPSGSYVQPQAQGADQCQRVAAEWSAKRRQFRAQLSGLDCWDDLGERLQSAAEGVGRRAHPFADAALRGEYARYRTFTHGDPKQANLFFRRAAGDGALQVGVIDFQWSGFGLASTDVAHFLTAAVHADLFADGGEAEMQRHYHAEVQKYLVEYGACGTAEEAAQHFSYATFLEQYDTAFLDVCRLVIAYTWARFTEPVEKDDAAGRARTMNKTSYNKALPNVVWLVTRCDAILKSRGF